MWFNTGINMPKLPKGGKVRVKLSMGDKKVEKKVDNHRVLKRETVSRERSPSATRTKQRKIQSKAAENNNAVITEQDKKEMNFHDGIDLSIDPGEDLDYDEEGLDSEDSVEFNPQTNQS